MMTYTINKLAKLAGISVRTLHYYDQIDLLKPAFVSENGYRNYEENELLLLQQILFYREMDFPLEKIKAILKSPDFDLIEALKEHKDLLKLKQRRISNLLQTVDKTIEKLNVKNPSVYPLRRQADVGLEKGAGEKMEDKELFENFDEGKIAEYQKEAEGRWGNTEAYKQSMKRVKDWNREDFEKVSREWAQIAKSYAENMDKGDQSPEVQAVVERHWQQLDKFYDCTKEVFAGLAEMYVADERFAQNYNKYRPHLAEFVRNAMLYYCKKK